MTVSIVTAVAAGLPRAIGNPVTKTSLSSVPVLNVGGSRSLDQEIVTYPSELQREGASLRVVAQSISRTGSQLDGANVGANQISSLVSQLQSIATRASLGGLTDTQRNVLNGEFQALRQQINNISTGKPPEQPLLDGKGVVQVGGENVTIAALSDETLFAEGVDVSTEQAAQRAVAVLEDAQTFIAEQQKVIAAAQSDNEFSAATVESALQNQEASRSTLAGADLTSGTAASAASRIQSQASDAIAAQTNRLPSDILRLISE